VKKPSSVSCYTSREGKEPIRKEGNHRESELRGESAQQCKSAPESEHDGMEKDTTKPGKADTGRAAVQPRSPS